MKLLTMVGLLVFVMAPSSSATAAADSSSLSFDYSFLDLYQYYQCDSLLMQGTFGLVAGKYLGQSKFVYEFQHDLIPFVRFRGRRNIDRVASTALVMSLGIALPAWTMALAGKSEDQIERVIPWVMAPFGSHLGYRPIPQMTFYAGIIPDVILFTEDDGLLLRGHVGVRIAPVQRIAVNIGIEKSGLLAFKHSGGTFPVGISAGVAYSPRGY